MPGGLRLHQQIRHLEHPGCRLLLRLKPAPERRNKRAVEEPECGACCRRYDIHVTCRSTTCHAPSTLRMSTYPPPPHNAPQKCSMYKSASFLLRFNPARETTKYPKLFGNL